LEEERRICKRKVRRKRKGEYLKDSLEVRENKNL